MDEILEILAKDARITPEEIAKLTRKSVEAVKKGIKSHESDGTILGYKTVIDHDKVRDNSSYVQALIEVRLSPEKNLGFDHLAERIYSFPEVKSCYLLSGDYDLLVIIEGDNIQTVANFVALKLSPMENVRGTTTHFILKRYKEDGHILKKKQLGKRPSISY